MARRKREHIAEMADWSHVLEPPLETKGTWGDHVILELGCGGGQYTLGLAKLFPDATVVGIDIKGARMWHGAKAALEEGLENVKFLRILIEDLDQYFADGEVDEIWITFPDPHSRLGKAKKRLTSPRFLEMYRRLLKPSGELHLKTDDDALFEYSKKTLKQEAWKIRDMTEDLYTSNLIGMRLFIQTMYEKRHLDEGRKIKYLRFLP